MQERKVGYSERPLSEFARKPMPKAPSASESLDALKKGSP